MIKKCEKCGAMIPVNVVKCPVCPEVKSPEVKIESKLPSKKKKGKK